MVLQLTSVCIKQRHGSTTPTDAQSGFDSHMYISINYLISSTYGHYKCGGNNHLLPIKQCASRMLM